MNLFSIPTLSDGNLFTLGLGRISLIDIPKLQTYTFRNSNKPLLNLKDIQLMYTLNKR